MKPHLFLQYFSISLILIIAILHTACNKKDNISDENPSIIDYYRIEQSDLQDWDVGMISKNNNVVLVKENDDDGSSHVLILMHQSGDTLSFIYQNDTLTNFHYNNYHFMVSEIDTMLVFTTIDGDMAVSYAIPSYEHVSKCNSKDIVSTLIESTTKIIGGIFKAESEINTLMDIANGDRDSLIHDLIEMGIEGVMGYSGVGTGIVLSYELYKHYINHLHNKAITFHLGNATCVIQNIQQNESNNTIEVTITVINGESIPNDYMWKNYWGQQVTSPNYVYYGVICCTGNYYPTLYKYDDYKKELLNPHSSITRTFSFPVMAVEKILFRSFLAFKYDYQNTALQNGNNITSLAKYGNIEAFYPEFEIHTIANPSEGGTVSGDGRYNFNTQITLIASANSGYKFSHWMDGDESNTKTIIVERNATYTAYFDDDLPDLSGTWTCTETHYNSSGEPSYTSYQITLYEDGTVDCPTYPVISEGLPPGTWSLYHNGDVNISINQLHQYTNYWHDSGVKWNGHIDNMDNPTTIIGYRFNWNYNYVGYFEGDHIEMMLTQ